MVGTEPDVVAIIIVDKAIVEASVVGIEEEEVVPTSVRMADDIAFTAAVVSLELELV